MRLLIRHVRKDYLIGEINNPQGSAVMICAYSLHRNGEYCDFGGGPVGFESVRHGSLFHEPLWSAARSTPLPISLIMNGCVTGWSSQNVADQQRR